MKNLSADFQAHLDGEVTTLCNCWMVIRKDGVEMGFTDHDQAIRIDNLDYQPSSGFEASQIEESAGLTANNHDVIGALMSDAITEADIMARRYDGARIRHLIVNWSDPIEHTLMQTYLFGEISREDGIFRAELKSLVATLDRTSLRRFEKRCNADLGDAQCDIDLAGQYTKSVTVSGVISNDSFEVDGIDAYESGWFTGGQASFTSGANTGLKLEIANHLMESKSDQRTLLSLWTKPHATVEIGDQLLLVPGCDKLHSTCVSKFSNVLNFRGFPHMPGSEFAMSYASNSKKMDGGPLIP